MGKPNSVITHSKTGCARLIITTTFCVGFKHPQTECLLRRLQIETARRLKESKAQSEIDIKAGGAEALSHSCGNRTTIKVSTGDTPVSLVLWVRKPYNQPIIECNYTSPRKVTCRNQLTTSRQYRLTYWMKVREQAPYVKKRQKLLIRYYVLKFVEYSVYTKRYFVVSWLTDHSHAEDTGKLGPKWEGPYEVTEALGKGAYKLRDMDGRELPRTWNICNLKKCYL
ncbi:hypothetical protein Tco_0175267 [Tanacetum coccineum]